MRFKKIYIEITNQCNLNCSFCTQNHRPPKRMRVDEFTRILEQIKPYTNTIYLHVLGEPLMHPELKQFLDLASQYELQVKLTTNGTLLDVVYDDLLTSSALRQINISLHAFPDISDYLDRVLSVSDLLAKQGVYISYRLWRMSEQPDHETLHTIQVLEQHYGCTISSYSGTIRLAKHCFLSFDNEFEWPSLKHVHVSDTGTCYGFRQMCAILSDGSVVPCCLDANKEACLGNIFETEFHDILVQHEPLLKAFRHHHMVLPLCQRCTYRKRFDLKGEKNKK